MRLPVGEGVRRRRAAAGAPSLSLPLSLLPFSFPPLPVFHILSSLFSLTDAQMHTQHNVTTQCPEPGRPTQTHRHTHTSAAPAIAALIDASPSPAPSSRTRLPATNAGSACSTRERAMLEGQILAQCAGFSVSSFVSTSSMISSKRSGSAAACAWACRERRCSLLSVTRLLMWTGATEGIVRRARNLSSCL